MHRVPKPFVLPSCFRFRCVPLTASLPVCAALLCLTGCGKPAPPLHAYLAFDTSKSARPQLSSFAQTGAQLTRHLRSRTAHCTLYRVDSSTQEFADQAVAGGTEQMQQKLIRQLGTLSTHDNTLTETFWTEVANRAEADRTPVVIVFFTDGYSEGTTAAGYRAIRAAASRLAANPHVVGVAILGAKSPTWSRLRRDLAPLAKRLGDRFLICSDTDVQADACLPLLESSRP